MQSNNPHSSRRAGAAAAATAAQILPINSKKIGKRPISASKTSRYAHTGSSSSLPSQPIQPPPPIPPASPESASSASHSRPVSPILPLLPLAMSGELSEVTGNGTADVAEIIGPAGTGRVSKPPVNKPPPFPRDDDGNLHLLQSRAGIDADEAFGSQEHALSSYLKLHPVLSLESTSHKTLQMMADLVKDASIPTKELEIVPKTHDDLFLRPPNLSINERPCCLSNRCICVWLARWRYGDDTDMAFVGTEFLLPTQLKDFKQKGTLPSPPGKCLVCTRYVQTYIYRCARGDPTFVPSEKIPLQAFGNALGVESGDNVPSHASVANDADGYRQEALLFVDEQWSDTAAAREGMASLLWRPVVKFCASHYSYVKDDSGIPRMLQRNVGAAQESMTPHFGQPVRREATPSPASSWQPRNESPHL